MTNEFTPDDIRAQAAIEFDGIISKLPEGLVPIHGNRADGSRPDVRWASTRDRDEWIEQTVAAFELDHAVTLYGGGNPRATKASNPKSQGGKADVVGISLVFIDLDIAKNDEFLPDHETANRIAADIETEMGLPPAYVNITPGGQHRMYLMAEPITPNVLQRIAATFEALLFERGYKMDEGTTGDYGRCPRYAGAVHSKDGSEPRLVTNMVPATTPVDPTKLVLREIAAKGDGSLVAAPAGSSVGDKLAAVVPMTTVLPVWGFTDEGNGKWSGDWPGASSHIKVTTHFPEGPQRQKPAPVGRALILSATMARDLGVDNATQPYGAFDWLLSYVTDQGVTDHRRAYAIAAGVAEHWMSTESPVEMVEWLHNEPSLTELQTMSRAAKASWPESLSQFWADRLAYRGVGPDVATKRGYQEVELNAAGRAELGRLGFTDAALDWVAKYDSTAISVLVIPALDLQRNTSYTARTLRYGFSTERPRHAVDAQHVTHESINDTDIPLVLVSTGRHLPEWPVDDDKQPVKLPTAHPGMSQVHIDAVVTAGLNEGIKLAALGVESWTSLLTEPGEDGHREARLRGDLRLVPMRGRKVFLAGREDWRFEPGLVDLMAELRAMGAEPLVIDTPPERDTARLVANFGGTYTVADALASGNHTLAELMADAYDYARTKWESTPTRDDDSALVERLLQSIRMWPVVAYDPEMHRWLRDNGRQLVSTSDAPVRWAWQALERSLSVPTKQGWFIKRDVLSTSRVEALLRALRGVSEVQRPLSEADSNHREIYCANGVVDLTTGTIRPRRTGENNRRNTGINYDPNAKAPRFERFLAEFFSGHERPLNPQDETSVWVDETADCVDWLQSLLGTAATGEVIEKFPIFVGKGSDGKSVLEHAVMHALGEYAVKAPSSMYTGQAGRFDTMRYRGARLVSSSETPAGATMDTATMKSMSERGYIAGEIKGGEHISFEATHLPMLLTNNLPKLRDTGDGVKRRIIVVSARLNLSKTERDAGLPNKLKAEAAGILRWLVTGAQRHYAYLRANDGRLLLDALPLSIETDTEAYFGDSDILGAFLLAQAYDDGVARSTVNADFQTHLADLGLSPWKTSSIGAAMLERGVTLRKRNGIWCYFWPQKRDEAVAPQPISAPVTTPTATGTVQQLGAA